MVNKDVNLLCINCFGELSSPGGVCPVCGYNEAEQTVFPHPLRPRTILNGKYLVGRVLGQGGFGITYIGWDLNLDLKVAVKEYYPSGFVTRENTVTTTVQPFTGSQEEFFFKGRDRFINEAKSLAKFFGLPGIVSVKDYFQENGTTYIVMEYIEGQTLKEYLEQVGGRLPAEQVFQMMKPVIESLAKVHEGGLVHRDISPDNIMISKDGYVRLLDFGAAREFEDSGNKSLSIMLKPGFAPEEQYRTRGVQGPWTDVYALSATIYKCITGVTPDESMERVSEDLVKTPSEMGISITPQHEAAIMKGMAVRQKDRYQSMAELYSILYGGQIVVNDSGMMNTGVPVAPIEPTMHVSTAMPDTQPLPATQIDSSYSIPSQMMPKKLNKLVFVSIGLGVVVIALVIAIIAISNRNNELSATTTPSDVVQATQTTEPYDDTSASSPELPDESVENIEIEVEVTTEVTFGESPDPTPTSNPDGGTLGERQNPVPLGELFTTEYVIFELWDETIEYTIGIEELLRGNEAMEFAPTICLYFDESDIPDDMDLILYKIKFTLKKYTEDGKTDPDWHVMYLDFDTFSGTGSEVGQGVRVYIDEQYGLDAKLLTGGTASGWLYAVVDKDDMYPVVRYHEKVWLALYE